MPQITAGHRIASVVRRTMAEKGISQTVLAQALGSSQSAMSRRLLGRIPFSIDELERIANALDVQLAELIAEPENAAGV